MKRRRSRWDHFGPGVHEVEGGRAIAMCRDAPTARAIAEEHNGWEAMCDEVRRLGEEAAALRRAPSADTTDATGRTDKEVTRK